MALLIASRPEDRGGRLRRLSLLVNNEVVGGLRPNATCEMRLPPGDYSVSGRMDWVTSPTLLVHLEEERPIRVEISLPFSAVLRGLILPRGAIRARVI